MRTLNADDKLLDELQAGEEQFPHLAPVFALHRALREAQLAVKAELPGSHTSADRSRLLGGEPLLTFDDLAVDATQLAALARRIMAIVLASRGLPRHDAAVMGPFGWLAEAQRWFDSRLPPADGAVSEGDTPRVVAAYALTPWLERAAERSLTEVDLAAWRRPFCPMCGGYPDLSFLTSDVGQRLLVCVRCSSQWPYRRLACPFCAPPEPGKVQYYPGLEPGDRLYVCDNCHAYLKTVDLRQRSALSAHYERVRLVPLDLAAHEKGYRSGCSGPARA